MRGLGLVFSGLLFIVSVVMMMACQAHLGLPALKPLHSLDFAGAAFIFSFAACGSIMMFNHFRNMKEAK